MASFSASQSDALSTSSFARNWPLSAPHASDRDLQQQFDDGISCLRLPVGASRFYQDSTPPYTWNFPESSAFAGLTNVTDVSHTVQAQLNKRDSWHDDNLARYAQHFGAQNPDFGSDLFGNSSYSDQVVAAAQPSPADTGHNLFRTTSDFYSIHSQVSGASFTGPGLTTYHHPSKMSPATNKSLPDAHGYPGPSVFSTQESDDTFEWVSGTLPTMFTPFLTDDNLAADWLPRSNSTSLAPRSMQCSHPSCASKPLFRRPCDFHKHYQLHIRKYSCRIHSCHLADGRPPIFALKKDRDRHERTHRPSIPCVYCGRLFSREDTLRNHCRTQHQEPS